MSINHKANLLEIPSKFQSTYGLKILPSGDLTTYKRYALGKRSTSEKRSRRGLNGISGYGRKQIRSACTLLEQRYDRSRLAFFTGTLPALPSVKLKAVCIRWSEVVRQFVQSVRRALGNAGLDPEIVYVTEIQEKRYASTGIPVPHIHAVWHGRLSRYSSWTLSIKKVQTLWERSVLNALKNSSYTGGNEEIDDNYTGGNEISFKAATNIQRVKKSAANYLSKYCSKGSQAIKRINKCVDHRLIPTSWYGMSKQIKAEIVEKTIKCESTVGFNAVRELLKRFNIKYSFTVTIGEEKQEIALISAIPYRLIDKFMQAYQELACRFSNAENILA